MNIQNDYKVPDEKVPFSGKTIAGGSSQFSVKDSNQIFEKELNESSEDSDMYLKNKKDLGIFTESEAVILLIKFIGLHIRSKVFS